jgi:hypothetical protein
MHQILSTPPTVADVFEAESLTSRRSRRRAPAPEPIPPSLRGFALILARCESAATLLRWRKQINPDQKSRLDAAVQRLQEAAAQVVVRASVPPSAPQRTNRLSFFLTPRQ